MSIESSLSLSLNTNASPRSLCVFPLNNDANVDGLNKSTSLQKQFVSTNPFDTSVPTITSIDDDALSDAIAVVYGTDKGSLHYRTYEAPESSSQRMKMSSSLSSPSNNNQTMMMPLGVNGFMGSHRNAFNASSGTRKNIGANSKLSAQSLPRQYFPMDLASGALPGSVVSCLCLSGSNSAQNNANFRNQYQNSASSQNQQQIKYPSGIFLLLIDDGRGSTLTQPGAYAAVLVKSALGGFQLVHPNLQSAKVSNTGSNQTSLPRMSCVSFYTGIGSDSRGTLVYGAGRTIFQLPAEVWDYDESNPGKRTNPQQQRQSGTSNSRKNNNTIQQQTQRSRILFYASGALPAPGVRNGQDSIAITSQGNVVVCSVGNSFYALVGTTEENRNAILANNGSTGDSSNSGVLKLLAFQSSSQVHPVIIFDVQDESLGPDWSSLFLASGRECAVVDLYCYKSPDNTTNHDMIPRLHCSKPRNGTAVLASPILAAARSWPWIAVLTSDGLVSIRSPSCLAISLRIVEVGQRPNDYFILRTVVLPSQSRQQTESTVTSKGRVSQKSTSRIPWIVAGAYSGECKVLQCQPDSSQDLADRLMRHAIDAFGASGFPRTELAEAVNASFTATSYVGPEPSPTSRALLQQYLEAFLGLADFESGAFPGWHMADAKVASNSIDRVVNNGAFASTSAGESLQFSNLDDYATVERATESMISPQFLLTGTSLLCLVCCQVNPSHNSSLANRAAKTCADKIGVVFEGNASISKATVMVCDLIAEKLLKEATSNFSLLAGSSPSPIASASRRPRGGNSQQSNIITDYIESSIWLLRSCGKHDRAIEVAHERLQQQAQLDYSGNVKGYWSQIKYESYTATHLSEIWTAGNNEGCRLVLESSATHRLLENNPRLGLSVFTAMHPQNEAQWRSLIARDDPFAHPERIYQVVNLLKSINPKIPYDKDSSLADTGRNASLLLPLESGRSVAISFIRSAIGIETNRPADEDEFNSLASDPDHEEQVSNFHDELSFLLLEGVIAERSDEYESSKNDNGDKTELGKLYRQMLRELLKWPLAKIRPEPFMNTLPSTFLQEKALVLGRIGKHEEAIRILYRDLNSLELALEYCDDRHARQKIRLEQARIRQQRIQAGNLFADYANEQSGVDNNLLHEEDNAYLPLIRVALDSKDTERGTATAIQVLALRRGAIDWAAALRLLPSDVAVSAVARPFLIPALVDSASQVRRLTVVSALQRARYLRLKDQLTIAQLKAQASIDVVPALKNLNLGRPLHSTRAIRIRSSSSTSPSASTANSSMPEVQVIKHFFPRHLVIQARITNSMVLAADSQYSMHHTNPNLSNGRTLADIAFVVAESSEEAIQPLLQVPIHVLPWKMTGSAWCVLQASPVLMDGATAQLTCELRYTIQSIDAATALTTTLGSPSLIASGSGRTYVEELTDLEVHANHFT